MKKENKNPSSGRKEFGNYIIGNNTIIQAKLLVKVPLAK